MYDVVSILNQEANMKSCQNTNVLCFMALYFCLFVDNFIIIFSFQKDKRKIVPFE